jgi:hypothetical protein
MVSKFPWCFFNFYWVLYKLRRFEENGQKLPDLCGDMASNWLSGCPQIPNNWQPILADFSSQCSHIWKHGWKCTHWLLLLFRHFTFPKVSPLSVSIAKSKVCNTLWALPKESPVPFRWWSNGLQKPLCTFCYQHVLEYIFVFPGHFLQSTQCLCLVRL